MGYYGSSAVGPNNGDEGHGFQLRIRRHDEYARSRTVQDM